MFASFFRRNERFLQKTKVTARKFVTFYPYSHKVGKISGRKMPLRNDRSQVPEIYFETQFCRGATY